MTDSLSDPQRRALLAAEMGLYGLYAAFSREDYPELRNASYEVLNLIWQMKQEDAG